MIRRKKFTSTIPDLENKIFVLYVAFFISFDINIYLFYRVQVALLIYNKASIAASFEYVDFADIFSSNFIAKLLEYIGINNYLINLIKDH